MAPDSVLVFGATGMHGGAVARGLLAQGVPVRAFVRDARSARAQALLQLGAQLVGGDLGDEPSLVRAMSDVPVAYAVTTPFEQGAEGELRQGAALVRAAGQSELPWLIFASVASAARAQVPHFQSKARIERRLRESAVPWTVVAPGYFYENVLGARDAISQGFLPLPLPADKPLQQVALEDLGALVAAISSRRDEHLSLRVEVAGDAPTPSQMAEALGVRPVESDLAELRARSPDLAAMYAFLAGEGYGIDVNALRARYPEVDWTSFAQWAAAVDWNA